MVWHGMGWDGRLGYSHSTPHTPTAMGSITDSAVPETLHIRDLPDALHIVSPLLYSSFLSRKKRNIIELAKERLGISAENLDPYGHYKAKVSMDYVQVAQGQEERQADFGDGYFSDHRGRGQDNNDGRSHRCAQSYRQKSNAVPARALTRTPRSA